VQRVVFPGADLDVVPLYVETNPDRGAAELAAEVAEELATGKKPASTAAFPSAPASASAAMPPLTWPRRPGCGAAR
jgi:hypothetical protein